MVEIGVVTPIVTCAHCGGTGICVPKTRYTTCKSCGSYQGDMHWDGPRQAVCSVCGGAGKVAVRPL